MAASGSSTRLLLENMSRKEFMVYLRRKLSTLQRSTRPMPCKWNSEISPLSSFTVAHRKLSNSHQGSFGLASQCLHHVQCEKSQYYSTTEIIRRWSHTACTRCPNGFHSDLGHLPKRRHYTTTHDDPSSLPDVNPYTLVEEEMKSLPLDIQKELCTDEPLLKTMSHYYFNGKGKTFRPLVALLMSKACNIHANIGDRILWSQKIIANVAEMIHTASLVHDDVIDASDTRRGQSSLNKLHGQRRSILVGDYILSQASIALARTDNPEVISILSSILEDLVSGEFMQLGSKEDENERFTHYLKKTYKKTASLIANTCKSVAILAECPGEYAEMAFQYGRNLGIAFQLVDDLLDFVSSETVMGKPTAADLKLGLATAPVLFAAQEHPELHPLIMRRFSEDGDVEIARDLVAKSNGVEQTKLLALQHSKEAIRNMQDFTVSDAQKALIRLTRILLERKN